MVNQPMPFDLGLVNAIRVNGPAVTRRAATIGTRRCFKVEAQVAALIRAVRCIDLTTLAGDDTPGRVQRLCAKALQPVRREILTDLDLGDFNLTVGAVCVYHGQVAEAARVLNGRLRIAAVSTSFPDGQGPRETRLREIELSIEAGATEIDVVIPRGLVLAGEWVGLFNEVLAMRQACGNRAKMKVILGTGNLSTLENVAKTSAVAIMAGADTIKTSTGKEPVNATLPVGLVMVRQIRRFRDEVPTDQQRIVGFKPAGGISSAADAMPWLSLMLEELGEEWARPDRFRFGASSLLNDIERQLEHLATGRYAAAYHQPMA
ncbi:MAG: deoxyribose-phosphate aldolase [Candidatus Magasanikbacteria bacterium RIFCSPHIGHO2_02_FULL_48_18]|nr:MAG: deoxyribose-phosphate aldolase [Candidatus Magasanikbacteria bacterium RIFCSPLOWO2_02_FULL_47_16]OGH80162.1 MAG: deoxyribose-phosphate aldolase [Candidatus Magasanikbacteria bacterium RIFCSPHIGHO2_02_FULL_48_18]